MKDRKTGPKLRVAHRNDHEAVRRWMQGNGQSLLPMLELLENDGRSRRHRRVHTSKIPTSDSYLEEQSCP